MYRPGPRLPNDGTPNPFGMVSRKEGLLSALPIPDQLPSWLTQDDLTIFTESFELSGFRGGLNYYRNLDRNWELEAAIAGIPVSIPALYLVGERDTGLSISGMKEIIASMPSLVKRPSSQDENSRFLSNKTAPYNLMLF